MQQKKNQTKETNSKRLRNEDKNTAVTQQKKNQTKETK
jgi:hypothetical protein